MRKSTKSTYIHQNQPIPATPANAEIGEHPVRHPCGFDGFDGFDGYRGYEGLDG
jgi:hypothetical protein